MPQVNPNTAVAINLADEFVRCVNKTARNHFFPYNGKPYLVRANSQGFIPFEAMVNNFGHPRSTTVEYRDPTTGQTIPARSAELERLNVRWGNHGIGQDKLALVDVAPLMEFYSLENERIWTVVDDPDGENLTENPQAGTPNDPNFLAAMVDKMERDLAALRQAQQSVVNMGAPTDIAQLPKDEPPTIPDPRGVRGARGISNTPPPPPPGDMDGDDGLGIPSDEPS